VLRGQTKGYRHHPQLDRFRAHSSPRSAISTYLHGVHVEARTRGYVFDGSKVGTARSSGRIAVTEGQLAHEWEHLLRKLALRSPALYRRWRSVRTPDCHPLMRPRAGEIEAWERSAK